ncbi:MAG: DUF4406 domain-containing protein [Candidatus Auribacterota bacterium]|nr:DUF4406 domain-containing protein [Candidatus Auribacterota bacterium]
MRIKVYVAGPYSSDNIMSILDNIKTGTTVCAQLMKMGFAPFCPWLDYQFHWYEKLTIDDYYEYSIAWLKVSDVMLALPRWETSKGTLKEIKIAAGLDIPIVFLETFPNLDEVSEFIKQSYEKRGEL